MKSTPVDDVYARNATLRADGRLMKDLYLVQVKTPTKSRQAWDGHNVRASVAAGQASQPLPRSARGLVDETKAVFR